MTTFSKRTKGADYNDYITAAPKSITLQEYLSKDSDRLPFSVLEIGTLLKDLRMDVSALQEQLYNGKVPRVGSLKGITQHPAYIRWRNLIAKEVKSPNSVCLRWLLSFRFFCKDIDISLEYSEWMVVDHPVKTQRLKRKDSRRSWSPINYKWEDVKNINSVDKVDGSYQVGNSAA